MVGLKRIIVPHSGVASQHSRAGPARALDLPRHFGYTLHNDAGSGVTNLFNGGRVPNEIFPAFNTVDRFTDCVR